MKTGSCPDACSDNQALHGSLCHPVMPYNENPVCEARAFIVPWREREMVLLYRAFLCLNIC